MRASYRASHGYHPLNVEGKGGLSTFPASPHPLLCIETWRLLVKGCLHELSKTRQHLTHIIQDSGRYHCIVENLCMQVCVLVPRQQSPKSTPTLSLSLSRHVESCTQDELASSYHSIFLSPLWWCCLVLVHQCHHMRVYEV